MKALIVAVAASSIALSLPGVLRAQVYSVSPGVFADTEAPDAANLEGFPSYRFQTVYDASDFAHLGEGPFTITRIDWRPSAEVEGPITYTTTDTRIALSTTTSTPANLSNTFADNVGADEVVIINGPVELTSQNQGPLEGPREFDYGFDLQTPFTYDPAAGNLLMDATVIDAEGPLLLDFTFDPSLSQTTAQIFSGTLGVDSPVAQGTPFAGHVIRFTIVPEPSTGSLIGMAFMVFAFSSRLRPRIDKVAANALALLRPINYSKPSSYQEDDARSCPAKSKNGIHPSPFLRFQPQRSCFGKHLNSLAASAFIASTLPTSLNCDCRGRGFA
jgi:hypothetical protein